MANDPPSDTVLEETPGRPLKLLGATSTNRAIRAALARRGYAQLVHEQGWQLTLKASGYPRMTKAPKKAAAPDAGGAAGAGGK